MSLSSAKKVSSSQDLYVVSKRYVRTLNNAPYSYSFVGSPSWKTMSLLGEDADASLEVSGGTGIETPFCASS